jgi:hypothetical protein
MKFTNQLKKMDYKWFMEARVVIDSAASKSALTPLYHRAYDFLRGHNAVGANVALIPSRGGFVSAVGAKVYDGLTSQLARVFHPMRMDIATGGARTGGAARGCNVDAQLADLINHAQFPSGGAGGFHMYTLKALWQLRESNLKPFCAQVAVCLPELNIATALDMVCINSAGLLVNVQLKTMGDRNYEVCMPGVRMLSPYMSEAPLSTALTRMGDSHANRHKVQLVAEHLIVQMGYGNPLADSMLMIITESAHRVVSVDRDTDLHVAIHRNLKARLNNDALELEVAAVRRQHAVRALVGGRRRFAAQSRTRVNARAQAPKRRAK